MTIAGDTFVEAGDTTLTSHTPSGANAGTSWAAIVAGSLATVIAASDDCLDNNLSSGNRFGIAPALATDEMDVQADFSLISSALNVFFGPTGRNATTASGWEFNHDTNFGGGGGGTWAISDGTTTVTLTEAWPGNPTSMKISCRATGQTGYVLSGGLWIKKVSTTSNTKTGQKIAGLQLGNFSGTATGRTSADNFMSWDVPVGLKHGAQAIQLGSVNRMGRTAGAL